MHAGKRVADTNATDQGESKKAEMGDKVSVQSSPGEKVNLGIVHQRSRIVG